jgi:predicted DNA-binding protein (UPF0278 family)
VVAMRINEEYIKIFNYQLTEQEQLQQVREYEKYKDFCEKINLINDYSSDKFGKILDELRRRYSYGLTEGIERIKDNTDELGFLSYAHKKIKERQKEVFETWESLREKYNQEITEYLDNLAELEVYLQNQIDGFVLLGNKLTKELAIKYSHKIKKIEDWQDESENLYLWFIESVANDFYQDNEAQEIAELLIS